jgi:phosphonate transport system substrate-binding protein
VDVTRYKGRTMKKIVTLFALISVVLFTLSACAPAEKEQIVIAFLPNEAAEVSDAAKLMIAEVQVALGDDYEVSGIIADDYSAVAEAVLSGTAQMAWESGATYAGAHMEDPNVIPLVTYAPFGDLEQTGYKAYIGTNIANKADFEGKSLEEKYEQLAGKSFSFVSATSTSGRLVPTQGIYDQLGPDGSGLVDTKSQVFEKLQADGGLFTEIIFAGTHDANALLIKENKVYAGAFCCNYGDPYVNDIYIIDETIVPNGPLWVNSSYLSQEVMDKLVEHFVNLTPETSTTDFFNNESGFFFEYDNGQDLRFVQIDADYYSFVEKLYAE